MSRQFAQDVYTTQTVPRVRVSTPHPKQNRRRHGFAPPQNAYRTNAPDILRVTIR